MKRVGNIWENIIQIDNIDKAIKECCKHKKKTPFVIKLLDNTDYFAHEIQDILVNDKYIPTIMKHKQIKEGAKIRDITIPKFYPDQIIHWAVCLQLKPIFMKDMYEYNCGSIPNRGVIYAKKYVERVYNNLENKKSYTAKLDIRKYYGNISQEKLIELLEGKIKDKKVIALLKTIIKSGEKGLPIGFYTSQWLSNVYLTEVDHFIKEQLHIKYYVRYVDDLVWIDTNKRKLHKALIDLKEYLAKNNYNIEIKDNWQMWKTFSRPLDFLGYRFHKGYVDLRKNILKKLKRQLRRVEKEKTLIIVRAKRLNSYLGWLKQINNSKQFYEKYIIPICSKGWISRIISHNSKRENKNNGYLKKNNNYNM